MRTTFMLITFAAGLPVLGCAQEKETPAPSTNSTRPAEAQLQKALPKLATPEEGFQARHKPSQLVTGELSRARLDGALVRAARKGQPWQVINPFAPKEFGDGWDNVSRDPHTGAANGVVLLSVRFGKPGRDGR